MGGATTAPYSAAKAAVNNLMESYFLTLKAYDIGVSVLCPTGINSNIHESTLTRPAHLRNTGYNVNETTIEFERRIYAQGIDPVELARIFKKGIENDVFYVLPFPDPEKMLRDNFERIVNLSSAEGMKRQDEATRKRAEEMRNRTGNNSPYAGATDAGWGKAKAELTWVDEAARAKKSG
jgi:hypothetical protein